MSDELRKQIYNNLIIKETDELLQIWKMNDHVEWSDLAFEVIKEILMNQIGELPPQNNPILEYKDKEFIEDDGLKNWEGKLLDSKSQPEFYDTLEVLSLKDNINKVATAFVVINIVLAILNFQTIKGIFLGVFPSMNDVPGILWNAFITILAVGINIAIVYFPLKALIQILRILMEMEFNSRKAKS